MGVKYFLFFDCIDENGDTVKINSVEELIKPIQTQADIEMLQDNVKIIYPKLEIVTLSNFIDMTNTIETFKVDLFNYNDYSTELIDYLDDVKKVSKTIINLYSVKQASGIYTLPDELVKFKNEFSSCCNTLANLEEKLYRRTGNIKESTNYE